MENFKNKWKVQQTKYPKLRTHKVVKTMYGVEPYMFKMLTRSERSHLSQLQLGILPIAIETGRFTIPKKGTKLRICPMCTSNSVEKENHFATKCSNYMFRYVFFSKARQFNVNFDNLHPKNSLIC